MTKVKNNINIDRKSSKKLVSELAERLEEEKQKSEDYLSQLKYLQADFDNFEKRMKRDREEIIKTSTIGIIAKLLPISDELELAIFEGKKNLNSESVVKGSELILTNLFDILKQEGVERIITEGQKLDPQNHEAVSFIETEEFEENTIVRELRKGYLLNNLVVRPAMVEVAKKPVKTTKNNPRRWR
jgi:molecular chaperone GrpE